MAVSLRAAGSSPEIWHAETGRVEATTWRREGERTVVPLTLGPWETAFVVMRHPTNAKAATVRDSRLEPVATLNGTWHVTFQEGRKGPASADLPLGSWSECADAGIRYFAGTGTYHRALQVPARWLAHGGGVWLNLGEVHELAEVKVNGKSMGVAWHSPYRVEISSALHAGTNELEIAVTNLWANRLIHDARADAAGAYTFTAPQLYKGTEALVTSGLVGPVSIELGPSVSTTQ